MNNKLLDDARAAGFYISGKLVTVEDEYDITDKLDKFAELQIPDGYEVVKKEDTKNENLVIPTLEQVREIFAREPNKNMVTETFDADLYKLVPIEPTDEKRIAGNNSIDKIRKSETPCSLDEAYYCYKAMLAASLPINTEGE